MAVEDRLRHHNITVGLKDLNRLSAPEYKNLLDQVYDRYLSRDHHRAINQFIDRRLIKMGLQLDHNKTSIPLDESQTEFDMRHQDQDQESPQDHEVLAPSHYVGNAVLKVTEEMLTNDEWEEDDVRFYVNLEPVHVVDAFKLDAHLGQAVIYILRAGKKGDLVKDLCKAAWWTMRYVATQIPDGRKRLREEIGFKFER